MEVAEPVWPGPALVVLAGAAGSGKSTWAAERYRSSEIVSSDVLRAAVGSGPDDLDASETRSRCSTRSSSPASAVG